MDAKPEDHHRKSKRDFRYAESQLRNLNTKIDKLLNKLDEKEQDEAKTPEEECVICVNSKATMQTWPCGHRVVCRKCLVRTIQIAVSRRSLPLRCVVCRARVLRLKRSSDGRTAATLTDAAGTGSRPVMGTAEPATSASRSHSLPTKLRRHTTVTTAAEAVVAVRSRSVDTGGKPGHRKRRRQSVGRVRGTPDDIAAAIRATGWAAGTDEEDNGDGYHGHGYRNLNDDRDRDDDHDQSTTSIKYSKLDATDKRHDNHSKNGLQRILGKFKFWRYLHFKNNKP